MFFAGAIRLTGPFVTMIYSMITGDMLTFAIIYSIMLLAFSQAFFFLHRGHPDKPPLFSNFFSTWMGLFQWTLGDYNVFIENDCHFIYYQSLIEVSSRSASIRRWERRSTRP